MSYYDQAPLDEYGEQWIILSFTNLLALHEMLRKKTLPLRKDRHKERGLPKGVWQSEFEFSGQL